MKGKYSMKAGDMQVTFDFDATALNESFKTAGQAISKFGVDLAKACDTTADAARNMGRAMKEQYKWVFTLNEVSHKEARRQHVKDLGSMCNVIYESRRRRALLVLD